MKRSSKYVISLVFLSVVTFLVVNLIKSDYLVFKIKEVSKYSVEKILHKGADAAIDEVFSIIEENERNAIFHTTEHRKFYVHPRYVAAIARQEMLWQNLRPGFKNDEKKYWNVAYITYTMGADYHRDYHAENAPKSISRHMLNARAHIIEMGKKYFSNPENLSNFAKAKLPKIKERFHQSSFKTKEAFIKCLTQIKNHNQGDYTGSKYIYEFLERRRIEGGDELVATYKKVAANILNELRKTT